VLMGLSVGDQSSLRLLRAARQDMSVALRFRAAASNAPRIGEQLLAQSRTSPTAWKYTFASLHELHEFQTCLTGADVLFDGTASSFLVARSNGLRTKREDLGATRLQILHDGRHDGPRQLRQVLAYFEDGQAMTFAIDGNDVVENTNSRGKFGIKLVEAAVGSPGSRDGDPKEHLKGFLCFGAAVPEGGERDDVTITFESEQDRDSFAQMLPATVRKASSLMDALHLN
jgi:hypothetical protein